MFRAFFAGIFMLPSVVFATCSGKDLRTGLTDGQAAEIAARVAEMPYTEGNLWRASKEDQTIHLIGTVHISDPRLDPVTDRLASIIEQAELMLVEASEEDMKKLEGAAATNPGLFFLSKGPSLIEQMGDEAWAPIAQAAADRGIPGFMAAKMQPWYLAVTLGLPPCVIAEMRIAKPNGLDQRLLRLAKEKSLPTESIEPYDTVFTIFNAIPLEAQVEMLSLGALPTDAAENALATLMNQYFEEKHAEVIEVSRVTARDLLDLSAEEIDAAFDQFLDLLLTQRNARWMETLEAIEADDLVVAVGAGHLSGETGLLYLLEQDGYTLERLPF
ncbi:MAG: TraB/GumN family protein [Pseudomonadota bacterium]